MTLAPRVALVAAADARARRPHPRRRPRARSASRTPASASSTPSSPTPAPRRSAGCSSSSRSSSRSRVVQRGLGLVRSVLGARLGVDINVSILEKALGLDLQFFEDPEFYDKLTRARREASSRPIALITGASASSRASSPSSATARSSCASAAGPSSRSASRPCPATVAEMRFSKLAFKIRNWRSPESRRLLYLEYVLANDEHAKEVKLFGIGPMLLERYKKLSEEFYEEDLQLYVRRAKWTQVLSLVGTGDVLRRVRGDGAAGGGRGADAREHDAVRARVPAGAAGVSVGARRRSGTCTSTTSTCRTSGSTWRWRGRGAGAGAGVGRERGRRGTARRGRAQARRGHRPRGRGVPVSGEGRVGAAARRASRFRRGRVWRSSGENGAGKTTLVKLLTRLYEPTEGRILLDGRDLQEWDAGGAAEALRRPLSGLQPVPAQGARERRARERRAPARTSRASSARSSAAARRDVVATLAGGLDAPLGRWFQDGTELSGGQWQKIALARAFMREEADILVLDEPTAALDAEAEHAVFTRFRELAQGRTTIVISHRFPTVRMAQHDRGARPGPGRGAGHARRARRAGREVRADVRAAGGGVPVGVERRTGVGAGAD